jgi:hypothetical protein
MSQQRHEPTVVAQPLARPRTMSKATTTRRRHRDVGNVAAVRNRSAEQPFFDEERKTLSQNCFRHIEVGVNHTVKVKRFGHRTNNRGGWQ